ncbi:MAG: hypothetical protein KDE32_11255 [Novosphingobium sp.]|nr:hypothetical protein [Novosphingobium sp.]
MAGALLKIGQLKLVSFPKNRCPILVRIPARIGKMKEFSAQLSNIPMSANAKKKAMFTSPVTVTAISGLFLIEILQLLARF